MIINSNDNNKEKKVNGTKLGVNIDGKMREIMKSGTKNEKTSRKGYEGKYETRKIRKRLRRCIKVQEEKVRRKKRGKEIR